jgi:hypothetical protein
MLYRQVANVCTCDSSGKRASIGSGTGKKPIVVVKNRLRTTHIRKNLVLFLAPLSSKPLFICAKNVISVANVCPFGSSGRPFSRIESFASDGGDQAPKP